MTSSNDSGSQLSSRGSPSSPSAPPRSPIVEALAIVAATSLGMFTIHHLSALLQGRHIEKMEFLALCSLIALPADIGLSAIKLLKRR